MTDLNQFEKDEGGSWDEYRRLVLFELRRIALAIESLGKRIEVLIGEFAQMRTDLTLLKFQAALWGAVAGTVFGAFATAIASALVKLWIK